MTRPYGVGDFGQVGANVRLSADGRNREAVATTGAFFGVEGNYYPKAWDVDEAFGEAHGAASAHLWVLHLRAGGKKVWGRYPFHEAAFLGGPGTVRSLRRERYAGDAAVYGNAELRLPLFRFILLLPVRVGVLGLADVGRVYLEGESSDKWHEGYGGGLWFTVLKPQNSISITAARDPDARGADRAWRIYFNAGFAFQLTRDDLAFRGVVHVAAARFPSLEAEDARDRVGVAHVDGGGRLRARAHALEPVPDVPFAFDALVELRRHGLAPV